MPHRDPCMKPVEVLKITGRSDRKSQDRGNTMHDVRFDCEIDKYNENVHLNLKILL
jgi:hypothetical protein